MKHDMKQNPATGSRVSLSIPVDDPGLFKHKATDDVLLLLSRHRFDQFTIGEVATRTGHTPPTVGRAVDVLTANDLVAEEATGNRREVRINRERLTVPDDPILRIPQVEYHKPVKAAVDELQERVEGLLGIILYGSVARGEADRRSDIDLWVLVSEDRAASQRTANAIEQELEDRTFEPTQYDYDIDVEAVASVPKYTEDIREIILSGLPMYETAAFETVTKLLIGEGEDYE